MKKHILLLLIFLISCSESKELKSDSNNENNFFEFISTLKLPTNLDFCGEKIPLEIPEVKERAEREFYLLLQQPGQLILYLKRSGRYFPMYEKILKENKVPDDLKFLSVAESALYMSRSSKDAVGLWQFIPETGRRMGLQIDDYVDERRHPEKSTIAAIKYLKEGYRNHKSWILAAAGYNVGHENILENMKYQNAEDFFELFLNEETSRYILRIIIIKELMTNPYKYGLKITECEVYPPEETKIVKVDTNIVNLSEWAKQYGTTYKYIRLHNPWILQRRLPSPQKGSSWEIAVPK